jgi:PEP-CTERM motif
LNIEVTGLSNGVARYSKTVVVNSTQAQWFDFNFFGIDSLSFFSYGGTRNPNTDGEGEHFIVDNFTYNEPGHSTQVPEPPALILFGMGIGFLGIINRRRKIA